MTNHSSPVGSPLDKSAARAVAAGAAENQKLLRLLADQILKLFRDKDLPPEIKLLLAPLLFMVPLYSLVLVIFLGDLSYCVARNRDFFLLYYLIFLGVSAPLTLVILLTYSLVASKFENSRTLETQLQSVTAVREPRRRRPAR
jgi:hypothetical protein